MSITDFLLARIEDDERKAQAWGGADFTVWKQHTHPHEHDTEWHWRHKIYDDVVSLNLSATYGPNEATDQPGFGPGDEQAYGVGDDCRIPHDVADHIVNWDPARVLAECKAKRAIIADHSPSDRAHNQTGSPACGQCTDSTQDSRVTSYWDVGDRVIYPCDTIRTLAAIHSNHPDYDPAWAV